MFFNNTFLMAIYAIHIFFFQVSEWLDFATWSFSWDGLAYRNKQLVIHCYISNFYILLEYLKADTFDSFY